MYSVNNDSALLTMNRQSPLSYTPAVIACLFFGHSSALLLFLQELPKLNNLVNGAYTCDDPANTPHYP